MEIQIPALIFPAISLLMLAYTNRFVVLAGLIRDLYSQHQEMPDSKTLGQIKNLQTRMGYIKHMQVFGAISFIGAVLSMFMLLWSLDTIAKVLFAFSLLFLLVSLILLLMELHLSINALSIQLDDIKEQTE